MVNCDKIKQDWIIIFSWLTHVITTLWIKYVIVSIVSYNWKTHTLKKKQTLLFGFLDFELSYKGDYHSQADYDQKPHTCFLWVVERQFQIWYQLYYIRHNQQVGKLQVFVNANMH